MANAPLVSIDLSLFLQIINFIVMIILFKIFLFNPISKIIEKRRKKIASEINSAEDIKKEAENFKLETAEKLKNSKVEINEMFKKAANQAEDMKKDLVTQAKMTRDTLIKNAEVDIVKMKENLRKELREETIDIATKMSEKLIEKSLDVETSHKLIDKFIYEMDK